MRRYDRDIGQKVAELNVRRVCESHEADVSSRLANAWTVASLKTSEDRQKEQDRLCDLQLLGEADQIK